MKRASFESFVVDDGNRAAYELCRSVAALRNECEGPIVLLGPEGSGKSHLLWSIVKQVRAANVKTGLALIMAREFPAKVRALAQDPTPIQSGKPAILLVDELQDFDEDAPDLEAVVRAFLKNGHNVVLAANVHPSRLEALSPSFVTLLDKDEMVEIAAAKQDEEEILRGADIEPLRKAAIALRNERDALKRALEEQGGVPASLESQLEAVLSSQTRVKHALGDSGLQETPVHDEAALAAMREANADLESKLSMLREEFDLMRQELASKNQELEALARADGEQAPDAALEAALAAAEAEAERDAAIAEKAGIEQRAEELIALVEAKKKAAAGLRETLLTSLGELIEQLRNHPAAGDDEEKKTLESLLQAANAEIEASRDEWSKEKAALEEQLKQVTAERDAKMVEADVLRKEYETLHQTLDNAQAQLGAVEFELEKERKRVAFQTAEMEALRQNAAEQVASANVQAGEMEHRVIQLETALDIVRETGRATGGEILRCHEDLIQFADNLVNVAYRLTRLKEIGVRRVPKPEEDFRQATLFETGEFEILPSGAALSDDEAAAGAIENLDEADEPEESPE